MVRVAPFPSSAPIQLRKAHFGDCADAAEKASVLAFPYFIHSPLEASHTTRGWHFSMRSTDGLTTFEDIHFSSLKVAVRSLARDARGHDGRHMEPGNPVDSPETGEPEANDAKCSF